MKASKVKMFSVSLGNALCGAKLPFPLYLLLPVNSRFVPVVSLGDSLSDEKLQLYTRRGVDVLWIPSEYQQAYDDFLAKKNVPLEENRPQEEHESEIVASKLGDSTLTDEEKIEILASVSQDLLRSLNQISKRGDEARKEGLRRCIKITDQILLTATQNSNLYEQILMLRQSQEDLDHSVVVSSMATMIAMALKMGNEELLGDIALAGLFHDLGLTKIAKPEFLNLPKESWSAEDNAEYENHPRYSVELLDESNDSEIYPRVFRIISGHHENYDGTGFPEKISGDEISDLAQILHVANYFDELCAGRHANETYSPAEAFDQILKLETKPNGNEEVQVELIKRIAAVLAPPPAAKDDKAA